MHTPGRSCVYCAGPADSHEHLWPDWLRKREDIREALPHVQVLQRGDGTEDRRVWADHPYKMKVRAVCSRCNNGWMSDLEQATERLMDGMLAGRGKQLHCDSQTTLAAWALKTAVMFDQASPADARVVPAAHARRLYERRKPPEGVRVWMAAYGRSQIGVADVIAVEVTADGQEDPDHRNVYVRTFTVGGIAFQVFGTTNEALFGLEYEWPEPNVHLIWPFEKPRTWMPRPALTDGGLASFGHRIVLGLARRALVVDP